MEQVLCFFCFFFVNVLSCLADPFVTTSTYTSYAHLPTFSSHWYCLSPSLHLFTSVLDWGVSVKGGSHWHSLTSLVLTCVQRAICRSGRPKDAPEPRRHSTGKQHSFLSLMQIHTPIQRILAFFSKMEVPSLSLCRALFLSVHPRQADALESVEVERRFCLSVSQLFFLFLRRAGVWECVAKLE